MMTEILQVLDAEVAGFPDRASGEQLYEGGFKSEVQHSGINERGLIAVYYLIAIPDRPQGGIAPRVLFWAGR